MAAAGKLITVAIHTYEKAIILRTLLEKEGIDVVIHNVNLIQPVISSGVRVRIHESDLPMALKIIEQSSILSSNFNDEGKSTSKHKQKILVPVDFSDYSLKACNIGFNFAAKTKGEVILIHSYIGPNFSGSMPFNSDSFSTDIIDVKEASELDKLAHSKMRKLTDTLKHSIEQGTLPNVKFKSYVTEGVPEEAILLYAKQENAQLIVMGTRGKSKKEAELIGSVTAEVFDAGKLPVFTVPENISIESISEIKNVVFFSNLHQEDLISFDIFVRLFKGQNINVIYVPIVDKKIANIDERIDAVIGYCRESYPEFKFSVKHFSDANFLKDFANFAVEDKIDLIIIPNKKKNIFTRLFNPSIAHKMLFHSDTPMLVIPI
ncbi:MAG: universal stress protein [Muribaculaceae bacterium]